MGNVYSVEYTAIHRTTPPTVQNACLYGGRVRCMFCSYEALSLASGSVIYMAQLRPAHAVLPMSLLTADALGSGVTLAVGDYYADSNSTDDPDRYLAAVAYNTAGQSKNLDALTGIGYTLTHEADIIVVTGGAEGSGTIELCLLYSGA